MTQQAEAARAVASEARRAAEVASAQAYRTRAAAEQAQRIAADEVASRDVLIINGQRVAPGEPVPAAPVPAVRPAEPARAVVTARPPEMPIDGRTWATSDQILDRWRHDGVGVVAIEHWKRDGADPEADLPYALPVMAGVLSGLDDADLHAVQGIIAELGPGFEARLYKSAAAYARSTAPVAGDPASLVSRPSTTKGSNMATHEFKGSDADLHKEFRQLAADIQDARLRNDHMKVRELDARRMALGSRLFPGDSGPRTDERRIIG